MGFLSEILTALVAAVILECIKILIEHPPLPPPKLQSFLTRLLERLLRKKTLAYVFAILLFLILSDLTPVRFGETVRVLALGLPKQERMIKEAFGELDRGDFQSAIDRSRAVIDAYEPAARVEERELEAEGAAKWKTGTVPWGQAWKSMTVFSHGSLNSVALAWWITGRSQQGLGHTCDAKKAYEAAAAYGYARNWDPQFWPIRGWSPFGWFWSPPGDAEERAPSLICS